MIDIHCHILPGVDDGAETMDDAIAMASIAAEDGITQIVATPHGAEWVYKGDAEETRSRVHEVQTEIDRAGTQLELIPGLEAHVRPDMSAACARGEIYTLNSSRYLLVEFPLQSLPVYVERALFDLQLRRIVPIIAHPERNLAIAANPEVLWPMVEKGILMQITAGSLTGEFGARTREIAELLVRHRIAHVIASDAHSSTWRMPALAAAAQRAAELVGQEAASVMVQDTPHAIVHDKEVDVASPVPMERRRNWFSFLGKKGDV